MGHNESKVNIYSIDYLWCSSGVLEQRKIEFTKGYWVLATVTTMEVELDLLRGSSRKGVITCSTAILQVS